MRRDPLVVASGLSLLLAVVKLGAYLVTGSLVVLGSFFDSLTDCLVSFVNSRVAKASRAKPDREHPFGHGGFEVVSSLTQGGIIGILGLVLAFQALDRLLAGKYSPLKQDQLLIGVFALLGAAFGGYLIQRVLARAEDKIRGAGERSLSVQADKAHYLADFWTNLGSAAGVLVVAMTGASELDSILGLAIAALLLKTAWPVLLQSLRDIVHRETDPALQRRIIEIAQSADPAIVGIHRLRSRELGPTLFVDFHMKLPDEMPLKRAHELGERVVRRLKREIPRIDAIIHLDPASEPDDELWEPRR